MPYNRDKIPLTKFHEQYRQTKQLSNSLNLEKEKEIDRKSINKTRYNFFHKFRKFSQKYRQPFQFIKKESLKKSGVRINCTEKT